MLDCDNLQLGTWFNATLAEQLIVILKFLPLCPLFAYVEHALGTGITDNPHVAVAILWHSI
jgi:hypothetical protein